MSNLLKLLIQSLLLSLATSSVCVHEKSIFNDTEPKYYYPDDCPIEVKQDDSPGCFAILFKIQNPDKWNVSADIQATFLSYGMRMHTPILKSITFDPKDYYPEVKWCGFKPGEDYSIDGILSFGGVEGRSHIRLEDVRKTATLRKIVQLPNADEVFVFRDGTIEFDFKRNGNILNVEPTFKICVVTNEAQWCKTGRSGMRLWNERDIDIWSPKVITIQDIEDKKNVSVQIVIGRWIPIPNIVGLGLPNMGLRICDKNTETKTLARNFSANLCWRGGNEMKCKKFNPAKDYEFENLKVGSAVWSLYAKYCQNEKCGFAKRIEPKHRIHNSFYENEYDESEFDAKYEVNYRFWDAGYAYKVRPDLAVGAEYLLIKRSDKTKHKNVTIYPNKCELEFFATCADTVTQYVDDDYYDYDLVEIVNRPSMSPRIREFKYLRARYDCSMIKKHPVLMVSIILVSGGLGLLLLVFGVIIGIRKCRAQLKNRNMKNIAIKKWNEIQKGTEEKSAKSEPGNSGSSNQNASESSFRNWVLSCCNTVYRACAKFMQDVKNFPDIQARDDQRADDKVKIVADVNINHSEDLSGVTQEVQANV